MPNLLEKEYTIFDLGYSRGIIKGKTSEDFYSENQNVKNSVDSGVSPLIIGSGDLGGNIQMVAGSLQSSNYVSGSTGWKLDEDSAELRNVTVAGYLESVGGSYNSASSDPRVRIFPDSNTGLQIIDDGGNDVFKALVGGTDVGDVIIGDYSGGQGLKYDKSAGAIYYKNLAWSEVVDDDSNKPDNNATVGATAGTDLKDSNSITLEDEEVKNIVNRTLGESVSQGDVVCIKPEYTDYTTSVNDTYVYELQNTTNYDDEDELLVGNPDGTNNARAFFQISVSALPPANRILKATLRLKRKQFTYSSSQDIDIQRVTSSWSEDGTVTWDNQPTYTDDIETDFGMDKTDPTGASPDWMEWDITQLVRHWKAGNVDNYGVVILTSATTKYMGFDSSEASSSDEKPRLRVWDTEDTDEKMYKADCTDYLLCRSIFGIAKEAGSADDSKKIHITNITSDISGTAGGTAYLGTTAGNITSQTTNLNRVIKLGHHISSTETLLDIQHSDILIEKNAKTLTGGTGATAAVYRWYTPDDARYAVIYIENEQSSGTDYSTVLTVRRDADGLIDYYYSPERDASDQFEIEWDTANNYIEITRYNADDTIVGIYLYN